jgi:hypothetical protein
MVSMVIRSTIVYGMNKILQGIASATFPRSVFPANIAGRGWSQMRSTPPARTHIIHIVSYVTHCIKATNYRYLTN